LLCLLFGPWLALANGESCVAGRKAETVVLSLWDRGPQDKPTPGVVLSALGWEQASVVAASAGRALPRAALVEVPAPVMRDLLAFVGSGGFVYLEEKLPHPPLTFVLSVIDAGRVCERVVAYESARELLKLAMQRFPRDSDARMRLEVVLQAIPTRP
jgi:hypothetical protein